MHQLNKLMPVLIPNISKLGRLSNYLSGPRNTVAEFKLGLMVFDDVV